MKLNSIMNGRGVTCGITITPCAQSASQAASALAGSMPATRNFASRDVQVTERPVLRAMAANSSTKK